MFLFYRRKADAQMCFENVSVTLYCKFVAGDFGASALRSPAQFCLSPILEGWNRNSPIPESQLLSSSPSLTPSLSHSSSQWTGETWPAGQPCQVSFICHDAAPASARGGATCKCVGGGRAWYCGCAGEHAAVTAARRCRRHSP